MFDWRATDGETIMSKHFWIYLVVALPLTLIVLAIWILWYTLAQKKYEKKWKKDMETANAQNSKRED
jgi:hypothetical protein